MTEAEFIAWQARVDKQLASFQQQLDVLSKRIEDIGGTEYRRRQDAIIADRRLKRLEQQADESAS